MFYVRFARRSEVVRGLNHKQVQSQRTLHPWKMLMSHIFLATRGLSELLKADRQRMLHSTTYVFLFY